jgi:hypothetical protein
MVWGRKVLWTTAAAGALLLALPLPGRAQDACSTPAKYRECSQDCCGRGTCSPACQGDCVRLCVEACRAPAAQSIYQQQLPQLRERCGYRQGPARMLAPR